MKIQELRTDLTGSGVGDNLDLAVLLYLAATVRKTEYKISVLVTGPAGLGKSYLAKTVLLRERMQNVMHDRIKNGSGLVTTEA